VSRPPTASAHWDTPKLLVPPPLRQLSGALEEERERSARDRPVSTEMTADELTLVRNRSPEQEDLTISRFRTFGRADFVGLGVLACPASRNLAVGLVSGSS
jgi:hypothetical protein